MLDLLEKYYHRVISIDMPELSLALAHCTMVAKGHHDACVWFFENMETRARYDWDFILPRYFAQLRPLKFFVTDATNHLRLRRNGFDATRLWPFHTMIGILKLRSQLNLDIDRVRFHFTHLVNNRSDSRYLIHKFLHDRGLLDVANWSYPDPYQSPYLCNLNKWADIQETQYQQFDAKWLPGTAIEQYMSETDLEHHACSAVTINTESAFHNAGPCYSGKIFKVMMTGRPFIEVSTAGTVADLHDLGFETFPELIDESYDAIADPRARIQAICKEIQRLAAVPLDHLKQYIRQHRDKFQHNFDRCQQLNQAMVDLDLTALIMPDFRDAAGVVDRDPPNY